jgi:16S rRNA (uracil1498-N3)-methyltransferase
LELYFQQDIEQGILHLDEEESRHAIKVLRHQTGDLLEVTDGRGNAYQVSITDAHAGKCKFKIVSKSTIEPTPYSIHLAIAPTKNPERIEWLTEKMTEIGVQKISIVLTRHSERNRIKIDRLQKKAISALKQSGQYYLPQIELQPDFNVFIKQQNADEKFIAYVDVHNNTHLQHAASNSKSYVILIGPEGDFSKEELQEAIAAGYTKVSLGKNRLRTETAGLVACHILNLINHK